MSRRARCEAGFTLVELMVAIVLALILTGGVIAMFLAGKQAYRTAEAQARTQESARFAMEYMARYIRMAGYRVDPFDSPEIDNPLVDCEQIQASSDCLDDNGNQTLDPRLVIRYHAFQGEIGCDGEDVKKYAAPGADPMDPVEAKAQFTIEDDTNAGGKSLHCNGKAVVRGITNVKAQYGLINGDGTSRFLPTDEVTDHNLWRKVAAARLKITVDTPDELPVNPGINGGDNLKRTFETTVYLRNLCTACEQIHAKRLAKQG